MFAKFKHLLMPLTLVGAVTTAPAYSLVLKGFDSWQAPILGYQLPGDIGGPVNQFRGEEYRWNIKTIYYGYDITYLNFFGAPGTNAVGQAFAILNELPAASQISSNLTEYPLDSTRINYRASALNLVDLKSTTLNALIEQMGMADPIRWTWCLHARVTFDDRTNYTVIKRNYDPVTRDISSYVNGVLYTYVIQEFTVPFDYADAVEVQVDPLQIGAPVASDFVSGAGAYFTGLTRDDIGAWKRLYENSPLLIQNHFESLPPGTTADISSSPWVPYPGGTNTATNTVTFTNMALRAAVDKIEFKTGNYDSYLGVFVAPITNKWTDSFRTNMFAPVQSQQVQRVLQQPDIVFVSDYLGTTADGSPVMFTRSFTENWVNNSTNNGVGNFAGPGTINGQVVFTYNPVGPYFMNQNPYLLDETRLFLSGSSWGSFDGTTNDPIVYPTWASLQQLQLQAIYGGGSPWTVANSTGSTNTGTVDAGTTGN